MSNFSLKLVYPKCKEMALYGGYPRDLVLSNVLCLSCNYIGVGASFKHIHSRGNRCILKRPKYG